MEGLYFRVEVWKYVFKLNGEMYTLLFNLLGYEARRW